MTARLRRQQRRKSETFQNVTQFAILIISIITILGISITAFLFTPRNIDCQTTLHTFCSDITEQKLASLKDKKFLTIKKHFPEIKNEILSEQPTIAAVDIRRTWHGTITVEITEAEPLFPIRWNTTDYIVRSNGFLTPASAPAIPILIFEDTNAITTGPLLLQYDENTLQSLQFFYEQVQTITPKIQKIIFTNSKKITLYPEGYGQILMKLGTTEEIEQQLTTLQAFFHSTTMDKEYKTLDIRFRDVIMK